ncbi:MAG: cation transporter [Candidatus Thiodiazotropha sp.]
MTGCDCGGGLKFDGVSAGYKRILWLVIAINASMFLFETGASVVSNSMALRADALDFLGDALTYGITLLAIGRSLHWRASAAIFKGVTLICMGLWVLGSSIHRVFVLGIPNELIMGTVALLAFAANMVSVLLLLNYRDGDANVRSVWLCSRNDAIGNLAVLVAAGAVFLSQSHWPDLLVALLMSMLFLHSAALIIRQARHEMNHQHEILTSGAGCSVAERD